MLAQYAGVLILLAAPLLVNACLLLLSVTARTATPTVAVCVWIGTSCSLLSCGRVVAKLAGFFNKLQLLL